MRDSSAISRSFVVSFFTQRHPQTKTNITERNDGLIDGTKSRRRWDFGEFKDFISAASQSFSFTGLHSKTEDCGKVASKTWSFKIWPRKTGILFYISVDPLPPGAGGGGVLLPFKSDGDTQIQTTKLSILQRFYFHDVLEQLKTNFDTNFLFKRVLGSVIEYAWIS